MLTLADIDWLTETGARTGEADMARGETMPPTTESERCGLELMLRDELNIELLQYYLSFLKKSTTNTFIIRLLLS